MNDLANPWQPIAQPERYRSLDVLRGLALLGVLVVNLDASFRISFGERMLSFHTHASKIDRAADVLIASVFSFKAFSVFSLCFGIGMVVQAERARSRGASAWYFLARRFVVLLALGLFHALLIWDGDILTLYAVCGLLLVPWVRLPGWALAILGVALIVLNFFVYLGAWLPTRGFSPDEVRQATLTYAQGSYLEITQLRWQELIHVTLPAVVGVFPRTLGLMLLGMAAWRWGVLRQPQRWRVLLWGVLLLLGSVGVAATAARVYAASSGKPIVVVPAGIVEAASYIPLGLAYAAAVVLWMQWFPRSLIAAPFAAVGQMALTNYLSQSVILGFIFFGYGLGLCGKLGPASAALIGLAVYAGQIVFSLAWLARYRTGPVEWLWRCLSYGRLFPLRRTGVGESFSAS